jgi:hypothetical protein
MAPISPEAGTSPAKPGDGGAVASLIVEIDRYLDAVETFRAAGCEPEWHPERPQRIGGALVSLEMLGTG